MPSIKFLESSNVKVFPCAYRGHDNSNNIFDPEARAFSEKNFSNIYSKESEGKKSFIISWDNPTESSSKLKCVIDGYYFEISNLNINTLISDGYDTLIIRTKEVDLTSGSLGTETTVLADLSGSDNEYYLDQLIGGTFHFTGLGVIASSTLNTYLHTGSLLLIENGNIANASFRLADVLDADSGVCAIRTKGTSESRATGDYSIALGNSAAATANNTIALGNTAAASAESAVAIGNANAATHINSVTIGSNLNTSADNQIVLGHYNAPVTNALLLLGNGDNATEHNAFMIKTNGDTVIDGEAYINGGILAISNKNDANKVVFSATPTVTTINGITNITGDTTITGAESVSGNLTVGGTFINTGKITGNAGLDVKGAITASGNTENGNILTLGSAASNDYGAINVYGNSSTTVFSVTNTGATDIKSTLTVANSASVNSAVDSTSTTTGALKVAGGAGIAKNVNIGQNLAVAGNATITGDITGASLSASGGLSGNALAIKTAARPANAADTPIEAVIIKNNTDTKVASIDDTGAITVGAINGAAITGTTITGTGAISGASLSLSSINITKETSVALGKNIDGTNDYTNSMIGQTATNVIKVGSSLHADGNLTVKSGDFAIADSTKLNTLITNAGSAYFRQKLEIGGNVLGKGNSGDTVFFRVGKAEDEPAFADLVGNLSVKNGTIHADGNITTNGSLTIGTGAAGSTSKLEVKGPLTATGTVTAQNYNATSDLRLKQNIKDFEYTKSILDLPIKEYEFIADKAHTKHIGCIAQELQKLYPELVHEDADGYLAIEENKLVYLLLEEVKLLKKEIKSLKGE